MEKLWTPPSKKRNRCGRWRGVRKVARGAKVREERSGWKVSEARELGTATRVPRLPPGLGSACGGPYPARVPSTTYNCHPHCPGRLASLLLFGNAGSISPLFPSRNLSPGSRLLGCARDDPVARMDSRMRVGDSPNPLGKGEGPGEGGRTDQRRGGRGRGAASRADRRVPGWREAHLGAEARPCSRW